MSGLHILYWLSALPASLGAGRSAIRMFALLTGLRWTLRGLAEADRRDVFAEFARAVAGRPWTPSGMTSCQCRHHDSLGACLPVSTQVAHIPASPERVDDNYLLKVCGTGNVEALDAGQGRSPAAR
jgi:hypothetical protein